MDLIQNSSNNHSRSPASIIAISISLVLLAVIGYLGYTYWQLRTKLSTQTDQIASQPTIKEASQPPEVSDETENWQTYTSPSGYSVSYPQKFQIEQSEEKTIIRIDPPDIRTMENICPRYVAFSSTKPTSPIQIIQNTSGCVYEVKQEDKIYIEVQYPKTDKKIIDQILSTFKLLPED